MEINYLVLMGMNTGWNIMQRVMKYISNPQTEKKDGLNMNTMKMV